MHRLTTPTLRTGTNSDGDVGTYRDTDCDIYADATSTDVDSHTDSGAVGDAYGYCDVYFDADCDGHEHRDVNADTDFYGYFDSNADSYRDGDADSWRAGVHD